MASVLCSCLLLAAAVLLTAGHLVAAGGHIRVPKGMRRQQISVFFHDQLNVTDVLVAEHKAGPITLTTAPFGSIFCLNDYITVTRDPKSALLGFVAGLATDASYDGVSYFGTFTVKLDTTKPQAGIPAHLQGLDGTINIYGLVNVITPKPHGIAGGTGSFMMAQGTATMVPIDIRTFHQIFRLDLDIFLPA